MAYYKNEKKSELEYKKKDFLRKQVQYIINLFLYQ